MGRHKGTKRKAKEAGASNKRQTRSQQTVTADIHAPMAPLRQTRAQERAMRTLLNANPAETSAGNTNNDTSSRQDENQIEVLGTVYTQQSNSLANSNSMEATMSQPLSQGHSSGAMTATNNNANGRNEPFANQAEATRTPQSTQIRPNEQFSTASMAQNSATTTGGMQQPNQFGLGYEQYNHDNANVSHTQPLWNTQLYGEPGQAPLVQHQTTTGQPGLGLGYASSTQPQVPNVSTASCSQATPAAPLPVADTWLSGQAGENIPNNVLMSGNVNTCTNSLFSSSNATQPQVQLLPSNMTLMSVCSPLGAELPQNIRLKIARGEFVDFASLIESEVSLARPQSAYALSVNASGQIICQDQRVKRRITSVHSWTSAFFVFSAVFLNAHPQRTQELLKYGHLIRTAASRFAGWGWRDYDTQFRLRQQLNPTRSWSLIDGELWALYIAGSPRNIAPNEFYKQDAKGKVFGGVNKNSTGVNPRSRGNGAHDGFRPFQNGAGDRLCYPFNNSGDGGCPRLQCKFIHKCAKCQASDHGARACKQGAKPSQTLWKSR